MKNEMSAFDYVSYAWASFKGNVAKLYSIIIPLFAVSILNSFISSAFEGNGLLMLVSFLFSYYASMVGVKALISLVRTGDFSWSESLLSLNQSLRIVGIFLLSAVFFGLLFAGLFIAGGALGVGALFLKSSGSAIIAGMFALLVVILAVSYVVMRLQFAYYLVVDYKEIGMFDALKLAWVKTSGKFWYMCAVYFWATLVVIGGLLAFVVGLIVAIPMLYIMMTKLYIELFDEPVYTEAGQPEVVEAVVQNTEVQNG